MGDKILTLEQILGMSQDQLLEVYRQGYQLEGLSSKNLKPPLTNAGIIQQVFTLTNSEPAEYSNLYGIMEPMPSTSLTIKLSSDSLLIITFSARGTVQPPIPPGPIPIVFIGCEIDDIPCQPNYNNVEFLYPQFCCDTRSFTWITNGTKGTHKIAIIWGMGNPTSAIITQRTLVVQAAKT